MVKGRYLFRQGQRLPTYFPNLDISLMPLSPKDTLQVIKTGWIREAAFRTIPSVNKVHIIHPTVPNCAQQIEIKSFLESVYGLKVEKVQTLNVQGRKKRVRGNVWAKGPDWKKAFVTFRPLEQSQAEVVPTEKT